MSHARLTRAEVRELDRIAIEELGIPGVVLMENAGRGAAEWILAALADGTLAVPSPRVLVLCGSGNNAGDGFVVARHLHNAGLRCTLGETVASERLSPDAAIFRRVTHAMGLAHPGLAELAAELARCELVVDALLGTGFHGALRPPLDALIAAVNSSGRPVVALDVPSGLDVDTGAGVELCVRAALTVTFVAEKRAFALPDVRAVLGRVEVVSIGVPPELVERVRAR